MVTTKNIKVGAVKEKTLAQGAVTADKLGAGAVTADKLGAAAVTAEKLGGGAVTSPKIASGAVGAGQLADAAVGTQQLAAGAVGSAQLGDGSVGLVDLSGATVTALNDVCPGTLTTFAGICMNAANFAADDWLAAAQTCANANLVLPDTGEAMTIGRNVVPGTELWTSDVTVGPAAEAMVVTGQTTNPTATAEATSNNNTFRCVAPRTDG